LLKQVEYVADDGAVHGRLAAAMVRLSQEAMKFRFSRSLRASIARLVDRLSGESEHTLGLAASPWRDKVLADIGMLAAEPAGMSRRALKLAVGALRKSKPSQAVLEAARSLLAEDRGLAARVIGWIEAYVPNPSSPELNEDAIRGLIWMLAEADRKDLASRIGKYCELCFKKVPNIGARSTKLGNGAIQTLGTLGGVHAVAELTRLKGRVRYPLVVRRIEAAWPRRGPPGVNATSHFWSLYRGRAAPAGRRRLGNHPRVGHARSTPELGSIGRQRGRFHTESAQGSGARGRRRCARAEEGDRRRARRSMRAHREPLSVRPPDCL
jgi:hypothetical protein